MTIIGLALIVVGLCALLGGAYLWAARGAICENSAGCVPDSWLPAVIGVAAFFVGSGAALAWRGR
jgi:hypothetical protein